MQNEVIRFAYCRKPLLSDCDSEEAAFGVRAFLFRDIYTGLIYNMFIRDEGAVKRVAFMAAYKNRTDERG